MIQQIEKYLEKNLSPKRLTHCIGTMKMCEKLARIYGVDIQKAKLVGISHDIAKEFTDKESLNYIKENNLEIDDMELANLSLVHGKIGADICKKLYGFDEEMR